MKYIFSRISKIRNRSIFIRIFTTIIVLTLFSNTAFTSSAFKLEYIVDQFDDSSSEDDNLNLVQDNILLDQVTYFGAIREKPSVFGGSYSELELELIKKDPYNSGNYVIHPLIDIRALNNLRAYLERIGWCPSKPYDGNKDNMFFLADKKQKWVPSIIMNVDDHKKTRYKWTKNQKSFDPDRQNVLCRLQTIGLVEKGHLRHWLEYELDYLSDMFGSEYDEAIEQVRHYIEKLEITEECNGHIVKFRNPIELSEFVSYPLR